MTSLFERLSDMRTARPQGLTLRITQPHGLRVWHIRMHPSLRNELNRIFTGYQVFSHHDYQTTMSDAFARMDDDEPYFRPRRSSRAFIAAKLRSQPNEN
jgi:hypothetical protein